MGRDYYRVDRPRATPRTKWSAHEETTLKFEWHLATRAELVRRLPGRSWCAIWLHARAIGLPSGPPEGCYTIKETVRRLGIDRRTLLAALAAAGVPVRRCYNSAEVKTTRASDGPSTRYYVEWEDARRVGEAWLATETVAGAARQRGIEPCALRRWLAAEGAITIGRVRGKPRRVDSSVIDRVVAARAAVRAA